MLESIKNTAEKFLKEISNKEVQIVSHFDTDGITSAAIITKALQRLGINFQLKIVKGLQESSFEELPQDKIILFVDLASNSFDYIKKLKTSVFIIDHHEITADIPENVTMINPYLHEDKEDLSSAVLCYLFAKELDEQNADLAHLSIVGMVGDMLEKNLGKTYTTIINESNIKIKKGLLLYPATRPIDRVLEYSSNILIPGVTGNGRGANEFLREIGMERENGKYKTILELNEDELSKLITSITLQRTDSGTTEDLVGNIYLVNIFNKLEDCREISAMINACSRNGESGTAVAFCLQNKQAKERVEKLHTQNKQYIVKALNIIPELEKIEDKNYLIINAQDKIKDTIIGTVASILSNSRDHQEGKAIIALAYNEDKIKVSARMVGKSGRNIREVLNSVVEITGGEVGGHPAAAGCLIEKINESNFIKELKKKLDIELVKI
jgi:RecJ-like exonuclease